mmetsp:Transcript_20978/g.64831  ORF Transcript_20978/g.64831 Transcript_20978/m.64831 type:complete len:245 (-) Transcript_20978:1043-1777(-)
MSEPSFSTTVAVSSACFAPPSTSATLTVICCSSSSPEAAASSPAASASPSSAPSASPAAASAASGAASSASASSTITSGPLRPLPSQRASLRSAAPQRSRRLVNSARASFCASGAKEFAASSILPTCRPAAWTRSRAFMAASSVVAASTVISACATNSMAWGSASSMALASRSSAPWSSHLVSSSRALAASFIALPMAESRRSSKRPSSASVSLEAFCFLAALLWRAVDALASSRSSTRACSNW